MDLKFFDEFGNKLNDISENIIEENYQNINYETPSNFLGKAQRIEMVWVDILNFVKILSVKVLILKTSNC